MLFPSGTPNCCASFGLPAEGPPRARVSTARCRTWRGAAGSPAPAAGRPRQEAAGRALCGRRQLLFLPPPSWSDALCFFVFAAASLCVGDGGFSPSLALLRVYPRAPEKNHGPAATAAAGMDAA